MSHAVQVDRDVAQSDAGDCGRRLVAVRAGVSALPLSPIFGVWERVPPTQRAVPSDALSVLACREFRPEFQPGSHSFRGTISRTRTPPYRTAMKKPFELCESHFAPEEN